MCKPIIKLEIIGVVVTLVGQICMMMDPNAQRVDGKTGSFFAYFIVISSGAAGAIYFLISNTMIKSIPISFYFFLQCSH